MCCGSADKIRGDHIKPIRRYWNLRLDPDNIQILCEECNHGKGSWDETDFRSKPAQAKNFDLLPNTPPDTKVLWNDETIEIPDDSKIH